MVDDPLHGKEIPFYNIQPREEHSPGGRCVTVRVYNQKKTIESKYRGFTTRCKQGQIRLCQTHLKKPDSFLKSILWLAEININLYPNNGKKKVWGRLGTAHDPKHTASSVKHGGAVWWHEHAWLPVALLLVCLLMMWQKTEKVRLILRYILPAQIQSYAAKLIGQLFIESNPGVFEGKKVEYSAMAKSISWSQPDRACIALTEDKTKGRKTLKQATTEVSCTKGLAKHHKGENQVSGDVHDFQT